MKVECDNCGEVFSRKPSGLKGRDNHFCSRECYWEFTSQKEKVKCEWCGEETYKTPSDIERNDNNFCSRECYSNWLSENETGEDNPNYNSVTATCRRCGKEFEVAAWRKNRNEYNYCSEECYHKDLSRRMKGHERNQGQKKEPVKKECRNCGKEFTVAPKKASKAKFCSSQCSAEYHAETVSSKLSKKVEVECAQCGSTMLRSPSNAKSTRHFCSHDCYGKWLAENKVGKDHPNWKGGYEPYYGENWIKQRDKALERDEYTCRRCGSTSDLEVHHLFPIREFEAPEKANSLNNLITLCTSCHSKVEAALVGKTPWSDRIEQCKKRFKSEKDEQVRRELADIINPNPVMEVGCGTQELKKFIHSKYIGVDFEPKFRPKVLANAEVLPFGSNYISTVCTKNVLQHTQDWKKALQEIMRVAKDTVILAERVWDERTEVVFEEPVLRRRFNPQDLLDELGGAEFKISDSDDRIGLFHKKG